MSFLLILPSGEGWETSLCRKEGKHQDKSEWGNPSPGSIAGSNKPWAWQNVESENLLWMNKWDPIFVFMEAAVPKSAFSLFCGTSLFHLFCSETVKLWPICIYSQFPKTDKRLFCKCLSYNCVILRCWASLMGLLPVFPCFMAIYINRSPEYCQLTQHTKSE